MLPDHETRLNATDTLPEYLVLLGRDRQLGFAARTGAYLYVGHPECYCAIRLQHNLLNRDI
jgi:hypothetical protein